MAELSDALIQQARKVIEDAESVFVLTGAGVSAESGVPTFRDAKGLWSKFDPAQVATPEAFERDPKFVWEWYDERRTQLKEVKPNAAHKSLAWLERRKDHFFILTQNVEDLHEEAGSQNVAHIHGRIWEVRCTKTGRVREDRRAPLPELPLCEGKDGALERPNVVWFGEMIREDAVQKTEDFLSQGEIDVVLVIGTEAGFGYIASWALQARGASGTLIEINPTKSNLPQVDIHLQGPAGEILPGIVP